MAADLSRSKAWRTPTAFWLLNFGSVGFGLTRSLATPGWASTAPYPRAPPFPKPGECRGMSFAAGTASAMRITAPGRMTRAAGVRVFRRPGLAVTVPTKRDSAGRPYHLDRSEIVLDCPLVCDLFQFFLYCFGRRFRWKPNWRLRNQQRPSVKRCKSPVQIDVRHLCKRQRSESPNDRDFPKLTEGLATSSCCSVTAYSPGHATIPRQHSGAMASTEYRFRPSRVVGSF